MLNDENVETLSSLTEPGEYLLDIGFPFLTYWSSQTLPLGHLKRGQGLRLVGWTGLTDLLLLKGDLGNGLLCRPLSSKGRRKNRSLLWPTFPLQLEWLLLWYDSLFVYGCLSLKLEVLVFLVSRYLVSTSLHIFLLFEGRSRLEEFCSPEENWTVGLGILSLWISACACFLRGTGVELRWTGVELRGTGVELRWREESLLKLFKAFLSCFSPSGPTEMKPLSLRVFLLSSVLSSHWLLELSLSKLTISIVFFLAASFFLSSWASLKRQVTFFETLKVVCMALIMLDLLFYLVTTIFRPKMHA